MKIVIAGKHELAVKLFNLLYFNKSFQLGFVTCKTERKNNRPSLRKTLKRHSIFPLNKNYSHETFFESLKTMRPDLIISAGFDKIIKNDVIKYFPNIVNVHYGLLPEYRGSNSIPWAILNNEKYIGITLHKVDSGIDSGDIFFQKKIRNDNNKSCKDLYLNAVRIGVELIEKYIKIVKKGKSIVATNQNERHATYYPPGFLNDYRISWKQTSRFIFNYIKASYFPPFKPSYSYLNSEKIYFDFPVNEYYQNHNFKAGHILKIDDKYIISTLNGFIEPLNVRYKGRKNNFIDMVRHYDLLNKRVF